MLVGIGPLLAWRRERRPVFRQLPIPALLGVTALAITIILWPGMHILPRLGFMVAAYLAAASILPLIGRNPLRAPLATWGMVVAHFGIAVALFGMAANAAFTSERLAIARPGEILTVGPWQVQLAGCHSDGRTRTGPRWRPSFAPRAATTWSRSRPRRAIFSDPPMETNESAIRTFWNGQLYTVVGKQDASGGWQLRLWWKPFVTLIWAGGALIALGGALALLGRIWRRGVRRSETADFRRRGYA